MFPKQVRRMKMRFRLRMMFRMKKIPMKCCFPSAEHPLTVMRIHPMTAQTMMSLRMLGALSVRLWDVWWGELSAAWSAER